jgi:hypothetical protein
LLGAPNKYGNPETTDTDESHSEQPDSKTDTDERHEYQSQDLNSTAAESHFHILVFKKVT